MSNWTEKEKATYLSAGFQKIGPLGFQFTKEEAPASAPQTELKQQLSAADNKNPAKTAGFSPMKVMSPKKVSSFKNQTAKASDERAHSSEASTDGSYGGYLGALPQSRTQGVCSSGPSEVVDAMSSAQEFNGRKKPADDTRLQQPADDQKQLPADDTEQQPADDQKQLPADDTEQQPADDTEQQPADCWIFNLSTCTEEHE